MGDDRRASCRICGRHRDEVGELTWAGNCMGCAMTRYQENQDQLASHSGPFFDHWRRRVAASVGVQLLDVGRQQGDTAA